MSKTGHKFVEQSARNAEFQKLFMGHAGAIQVEPGSWVKPRTFQRYADDIACIEYEENEVLVMTVPKSGTAWAEEIVWTMKNNPNLDNPSTDPPSIRAPVIGMDTMAVRFDLRTAPKELFEAKYPGIDQSEEMLLPLAKMSPKPRLLKTHLPYELLSDTALNKAKVVYMIRDPRDVCISYHHHCRIFYYENFTGTFDQFVDSFLAAAVLFTPYWGHVKQAWKLRHHPNLHIIFYEKLKKNTKEEYMKLSNFLGTDISESQMEKIIEYTSFDEMKKRGNHFLSKTAAPTFMNMAVIQKEGGYFRQGMSGGWRKVLTQEQKDKFQVWIDENCPDEEIMNSFLNP